jgi:hypothetical protein
MIQSRTNVRTEEYVIIIIIIIIIVVVVIIIKPVIITVIRGRSVSAVIRLHDGRPGFATASTPVLCLPSLIPSDYRALSSGLKRTDCEAHHSPPPSADSSVYWQGVLHKVL